MGLCNQHSGDGILPCFDTALLCLEEVRLVRCNKRIEDEISSWYL